MKHRQTGLMKVGLINPDGHAIGVDIGATSVRAAILSPGTHEGLPGQTRKRLPHSHFAAGRQGGAFGFSLRDKMLNPLALPAHGQRSHLHRRIERVADFDGRE